MYYISKAATDSCYLYLRLRSSLKLLWFKERSSRFVSPMLATWLRLPPVCPSKARVNPGRLSSPTWKRPLNGCFPQSANTLAEAEGGSGAGVTLWHGSPESDLDLQSASALPSLLCDALVSACTHTADRQRGRAGEELCIFLSGSETTLYSGEFSSSL